jgi:hypothetical protein
MADRRVGSPRDRLERYLADHGVDLDANEAVDAFDAMMQWVINEALDDDVLNLQIARYLVLQILPEKEV